MFSIENQPDPLCSYKISGLKSDERSSDHTLALEEQVDLLKSGPSDDKTPPSFSIRDYVSTSRKNGIEKNWPFSQQHLELCSKHGVTDMLPPFEPPDLIKNRSSRKSVQSCELVCTDGRKSIVDGKSGEEGNTISNFLRSKTCLPIDQPALGLSDQAQVKFAVDPIGTDTCKLSRLPTVQGNRKGVTSTVNNSGQSERENVSSNRFRRSGEVGTSSSRTLRELEVVEAHSALQKSRNTIDSPSKKCKVIVNLDNLSNPSRCEDIGGSGTTISEVMSSKVCPVCKTFLSTSNTTLNAHIDQCLAMESTSKWAGNVIFSKSKAKPRKKRLMVDIYATAPRCTLEDLDRRNGSNWAADASLPASNTEACAEGRRQRFFQEFSEDNSDENAVYFDSNGKKLRILSKLDDASVLRVGDDVGPRKQANENKESNPCLPGKVRRLGLKDSNYLKVKSQKTKYYSSRPDRLEICKAPEGTCRLDEIFGKEESLSELLKARDHTNPGELRQWVCSKRTGLSKKFNSKDGRQRQGYPSLTTRDPLIDNNQSIVGNSSLDTSCIRKLSNPLGNPNFSPRSRQIEKPSSYGVRISDKGERSEKPSESHFNRLNDGSTCSTHVGSVLKFSSSSRDHDSFLRSKRVEVRASLAENSNSVTRRVVSPSAGQRMSSNGKNVSSSMKNLSLVGPSSPHFRSTNHGKCSTLKKSRTDGPTMKTIEQVRATSSDMEEEYDQMHDSTASPSGSFKMIRRTRKSASSRCEKVRNEVSVERNGLLNSGQRGETLRISGRVEPKALQSRKSGPQEATLSSKSSPTEPNVSTYVRGLVIRSAETSVSEFHKQATPSNARSNCLQSIGEEDTSLACRTEAQIGSSEQSFCDDQDTDFVEEVGIGDKVGGNTIPEPEYTECGVEQISIPGPPGFFLPSPGEIGSDVHVENSSLTSNRLPSSLDQYFPADRDSSGSPVSATSTISHYQSSRADPKYVESTSYAGPRADLEKFVSSFTSGNTKQNIEKEYKSYFDKDSVRSSTISRDDHHCRCAWKEGVTWVSPSSYQDPQLLKQHSIAPTVIPTEGSQRNWTTNEKIVPIVDSSRSFASSKVLSPDAAPKFPGDDKFGSAGSSSSQACHPQPTTNPVLRLMGKNLMVVNSEKDASVEIKESQPICPTDVRNERYPTLQGFSIGNVSTNDCVSFYHMAPDGSVVFNRDPSNPSPVSSNRNNINFGDFMGSRLPQNGSRDRNELQTRQTVPIDRLNSQFTYHADRGAYAAPQPQQQYPYFSAQAAASSRREVIVIDDSQDNEADLNIKYSQGSKEKLPSPVGVLPSPTSGPNMRQVNSFYCYPSPNPYMPREPPPAIPYPIMYPRGTNSQVKQGDSLYAFTPKLR